METTDFEKKILEEFYFLRKDSFDNNDIDYSQNDGVSRANADKSEMISCRNKSSSTVCLGSFALPTGFSHSLLILVMKERCYIKNVLLKYRNDVFSDKWI